MEDVAEVRKHIGSIRPFSYTGKTAHFKVHEKEFVGFENVEERINYTKKDKKRKM